MHNISASYSAILRSCVYPFSHGHLGDFENDGDRFVVIEYELRIGRLTGIVPAETSAYADDSWRKCVVVDGPAGHVHLVDTLIPQIAVAGVPDKVPVKMQLLAHQGFIG